MQPLCPGFQNASLGDSEVGSHLGQPSSSEAVSHTFRWVGWRVGCEDLGLDAFVTLETSFQRACGPVALGVHTLLLAPPASKQAKVRTKTLQAEFPRDSRLSGPGRCPLLLAGRAGKLQIRPGPDPLGGFQAYRSWPGRAFAAGASLLRDVGCGPRERRPL